MSATCETTSMFDTVIKGMKKTLTYLDIKAWFASKEYISIEF